MEEVKRIDVNGRLSRVVDCGNLVFFSGMTSSRRGSDVTTQTKDVLFMIDGYLEQVSLTRQDVVSAQIWLKDIQRDFQAMNAAWDAWIVKGYEPARATVGAELADDALLVEIAVVAGRPAQTTPIRFNRSTSVY